MTVSQAGLLFIARFEGYRPRAYNDAGNNATIGYGHLLHYGPVRAADRLRYWTRATALKWLRIDATRADAAVWTYCRKDLTQHEHDALVSFAYNCGGGALAHSTLLRDVNHHAADAAIEADFVRWDHAGGVELPGLRDRRLAEARLYIHGTY